MKASLLTTDFSIMAAVPGRGVNKTTKVLAFAGKGETLVDAENAAKAKLATALTAWQTKGFTEFDGKFICFHQISNIEMSFAEVPEDTITTFPPEPSDRLWFQSKLGQRFTKAILYGDKTSVVILKGYDFEVTSLPSGMTCKLLKRPAAAHGSLITDAQLCNTATIAAGQPLVLLLGALKVVGNELMPVELIRDEKLKWPGAFFMDSKGEMFMEMYIGTEGIIPDDNLEYRAVLSYEGVLSYRAYDSRGPNHLAEVTISPAIQAALAEKVKLDSEDYLQRAMTIYGNRAKLITH